MNKRKNYLIHYEKGFSIVEILLIILVFTMVGVSGWYVLRKNNTVNDVQTTTLKAALAQPDPSEPIAVILEGSSYNVVAKQGDCEMLDKSCNASYIVKLSDYAKDFQTVYRNLVDENWKTMEGRPFTLNLEGLQDTQNDYNYSIFSFITLGLFGEDAYIENSGIKARFFAFSQQEKQNNDYPYYIYDSEVDGEFDWQSLLDQLNEGEYYLNISLKSN